jgi:hypothetical protein
MSVMLPLVQALRAAVVIADKDLPDSPGGLPHTAAMGPQGWAALIGAVAGGLIATLKYALDSRARANQELWNRRLYPYREIWALSASFSRWPRKTPTLTDVDNLRKKLRLWYYRDGGILMSARARRRYGYVQKGLEAIKNGRHTPDDTVREEDYDHMTEVLSRFRSALTEDLESRRKRSVVYTLTDLSQDYRTQDELELWQRTLLKRHGLGRATDDRKAGTAAVLGHSPWHFLVIAVCAAGALLIMQLTSGPEDRDAAVVTLAAALIAATGTSLGHNRGRRDAMFDATSRAGGYRHAAILVGLLAAVTVVTTWVHWVWPDGRAITEDGLAALCAAVLGVVGTVAVNELALRSTTHIVVGVALLVLSLAGGVLALITTSKSSAAEIGVSYAAAAVGVSTTLLGHTTGRATPQRLLSQPSTMQMTAGDTASPTGGA